MASLGRVLGQAHILWGSMIIQPMHRREGATKHESAV